MNNGVFVSYRRSASGFLPLAIYQDLRANDVDAFIDVRSITTGHFDLAIRTEIAARPYFLPVLTPGTLDRCVEPGDWVLEEIAYAVSLKRNIVPVVTPDFEFSDLSKFLPPALAAEMLSLNAVKIEQEWFEEGMIRLRTRFIKPIDLPVIASAGWRDLAPQPSMPIAPPAPEVAITGRPISAAEYFERALAARAFEDIIAEYDNALRVDPGFVDAWNNRGVAHRDQGNLDSALVDLDEAVRLAPDDAQARSNRGMVQCERGNYGAALTDLDAAVRLAPQDAEIRANRGVVRFERVEIAEALADFTEAIRLNPQHAFLYHNRGLAFGSRELRLAREDFETALRLNPQFAPALAARAALAFTQREYAAARTDFARAVQVEPSDLRIRAGYALTLFADGEQTEGERLWRSTITQEPRYADRDFVRAALLWPALIDAAAKQAAGVR